MRAPKQPQHLKDWNTLITNEMVKYPERSKQWWDLSEKQVI